MTKRPTRTTAGGRAYLDLRKAAAAASRPTDEYLQLYALEGFLDRLSRSPHADRFVLKGGVLLAVYSARRPTRDVDLAAIDITSDLAEVRTMVNEIITVERDDGLVLDLDATTVESIRDDDHYGGARVVIHGSLATAVIQFHVDVNTGDPLWPPPEEVELPRILGGPPVRLRGYRVELIIAEKIITALQRGTANTRWRDFVDVVQLCDQPFDTDAATESIRRVAAFRGVSLQPLRDALAGYPEIAQAKWAAWRRKQHLADTAPASFADLLDQLTDHADPLLQRAATSGS